MSLQIGIYDFFAHTLPGGLYLLAVLLITELIAPGITGISLTSISLVELLLLGFVAYILGLLSTPIAFRVWQVMNRHPNLALEARERVGARFPDFKLRFGGAEWAVLAARIALTNTELAARIDKHRATGIMMRNTTPALLVLAGVTLMSASLHGRVLLGSLCGGALSFAAYLSNLECRKYLRWSYSLIFEVTIAEALQSTHVVRLKEWAIADNHPRGRSKRRLPRRQSASIEPDSEEGETGYGPVRAPQE